MVPLRLFSLSLLLTASPLGQYDRFGAPACSSPDRELANRTYFVLCHSTSRKVPVWVGYELRPEHLNRVCVRPRRFRRDLDPANRGAADADYTGSGFSRGHMAPAADFTWV